MFQPYFEATEGLVLAEEDVRRLFSVEQKAALLNPSDLSKAFKTLSFAALVLIVAYIGLNAPALWAQTHFYVENEFQTKETDQGSAPAIPIPGQTPTTTNTAPAVGTASNVARQYEDNHLYIDRIKVNAPIIWDVADDNETVLKNLQNGVTHLKGNAKPGQKGTVFIVGHSSNFSFAKGDYKRVFALLPQLKIGDEIVVVYHNTPIRYRVTEYKTVKPDDVSVRENADDQKLNLMTCVPLGTNYRRLVVSAKPVGETVNSSSQLPQ